MKETILRMFHRLYYLNKGLLLTIKKILDIPLTVFLQRSSCDIVFFLSFYIIDRSELERLLR